MQKIVKVGSLVQLAHGAMVSGLGKEGGGTLRDSGCFRKLLRYLMLSARRSKG